MSDHIQKEWEAFRDKVLPDGAPEVQLREMRRAFFAGAISLRGVMFKVLEDTGDPNEVTEGDLRVMEDINDEFERYADDLQHGRA